MPHHLRAYRADDDTSDTGPIRFTASTEGIKRDGMDLSANDWVLDNFRANPVVLWGHDYFGARPPIGRADVEIVGPSLMADITFDPDDDFAATVERKYRSGFLHSVSVGWDPISDNRNDLLDISAVPVPGDPNALIERQIRGIRAIDDILTEITNDDDSTLAGFDAEAQWGWAAHQMVRLFTAGADDGIDPQVYRRLCRQYQRAGKTPPELPAMASLLGMDTIRGLFLEGEPDLVPELFRTNPTPPDDDEDTTLTRLHQTLMGGTHAEH